MRNRSPSGDSPALLHCPGTGRKQNLLDYMSANGCLPEGEALFVVKQTCKGVAYCHSLDIAHWDLEVRKHLPEQEHGRENRKYACAHLDLSMSTS